MIQKSVINTRTTATHLIENLNNLDTYIYTVDSDIERLNQYVKVYVDVLKARGDRTDDLMINLFKDYQVAPDG